jgi:ferredoxin/flavodoxin---NADP+ reductase
VQPSYGSCSGSWKPAPPASTSGNLRADRVEAPRIARKQRPGQFVILRLHENGERIPLTIKSADPAAGTITIVVQAVGKTTSLLNSLEAGDSILDSSAPSAGPPRSGTTEPP